MGQRLWVSMEPQVGTSWFACLAGALLLLREGMKDGQLGTDRTGQRCGMVMQVAARTCAPCCLLHRPAQVPAMREAIRLLHCPVAGGHSTGAGAIGSGSLPHLGA